LAAILTTFNSILNASAALWVCDIHETYVNKNPNIKRLSLWVSVAMVVASLLLVPFFATQDSLINTVQTLYGLLSMPILSAFIVGVLFKNVDARAMIISVVFGVLFYFWMLNPLAVDADLTTQRVGLHYIHLMAINLITMVVLALLLNRAVFKKTAKWDAREVFSKAERI